jgi:hypothetical protein
LACSPTLSQISSFFYKLSGVFICKTRPLSGLLDLQTRRPNVCFWCLGHLCVRNLNFHMYSDKNN